jgi:ribosome-binding factor A
VVAIDLLTNEIIRIMPREFSRKLRVEEVIQREIAILIQQEIKDPRVGLVTVSGVDISPDLKHAKIFVTSLNDAADPDDSIKALNHAARFLRHELAKRVYLKTIPDIRFIYDRSVKEGTRLAEMIDAAVASEKQHGGTES